MTLEEYNEKEYKIYRDYNSKEVALYGKCANRAEEEAAIDAVRREREEKKEELAKEFWSQLKVGDGVTLNYYCDRESYTVIKKTASTITIQRDKVTLKKDWIPKWDTMYCYNNREQKWDIEPDPEGDIEILHWRKSEHGYGGRGINSVSYGRNEFYDYNF